MEQADWNEAHDTLYSQQVSWSNWRKQTIFVEDQKQELSFLHDRDLESSVLPKQHQSIHRMVYLLGYNMLGKFKVDCPIFTRDILNFVLWAFNFTPCDVIGT